MKNYSDAHQDIFAYLINDKKPGFWVDIGARNFSGGGFGFNNTQFLYENGWKGLSIDIGDYSLSYKGLKGVTFENVDATNADALRKAFTKNNVPPVVDYLSHDIDAAAWDGLITLDWTNYKFKCITLEHDAYHQDISIRNKQREFLQDLGYEIIASLEKDALEEKTSTIKTSLADYLRFERNKKNEDDEQVMDEEIELELDEEEDNSVDLDELMNDYKKAKVAKMEEEYTNKVKSLNKALKEANNKAQQMETKLSEMNLLNAKLLYANRILQEHSLTKDEKSRMLETIQKAKKINEVKLVYEVLNERYASSTKNISESLGFASRTISSTSVKNDENILNESIADRFKILANIK